MKEHTPLQLLVQEGVQVVRVWEEEGNIILRVEVQPKTACPLCGKGKLHGHGRLRERRVHHQFLSFTQGGSDAPTARGPQPFVLLPFAPGHSSQRKPSARSLPPSGG